MLIMRKELKDKALKDSKLKNQAWNRSLQEQNREKKIPLKPGTSCSQIGIQKLSQHELKVGTQKRNSLGNMNSEIL